MADLLHYIVYIDIYMPYDIFTYDACVIERYHAFAAATRHYRLMPRYA